MGRTGSRNMRCWSQDTWAQCTCGEEAEENTDAHQALLPLLPLDFGQIACIGEDLLSSAKSPWKCRHRQAQKCVSWLIRKSIQADNGD